MIQGKPISLVLRDIADKEILTSLFMNDLSIMNGQMGVTIFFALLSRITGNHSYEEFANELLMNICNNLSQQIPIDFSHGICGIGWGIEFLKYQGFIEGDTDEILSELDIAVMERDVRHINNNSLETGLYGIYSYVVSRMNTNRSESGFKPFDTLYLSDLNDAMDKLFQPIPSAEINEVWRVYVSSFRDTKQISWQRGLFLLVDGGYDIM